jgi:hypothetical protein
MRHEQIRQLLTAQPFRPFTIFLPEGRIVEVFHHDFALLSPDGRTLVVSDRDGVMNIIDVMLITSVEIGPPAPIPAPATITNPASDTP